MDEPPPRSNGDEREVLLLALGYVREGFARKVDGLSDEDARRVLVPSGTTLLWLTEHLAAAERIWLYGRFRGEGGDLGRWGRQHDTIAAAIEDYRASWAGFDEVMRDGDLDAEIPDPNGGEVPLSLRWIVVHLIEEVARHAGHADILRELLDGQTGR